MRNKERRRGRIHPKKSLLILLNGLQRYIQKTEEFNIWKDSVFTPLKNVCNSLFKHLHNSGVGADIKSTPVLTPDDEDKLWAAGILSLENPTGLLRAVFSTTEKTFVLEEARNKEH